MGIIMNNKVSIIVPVFNKMDFVGSTIESLKAQSHENCEFLLVDDKSTDNSLEVMRTAIKDDERFKIIRRENNGGLSAARNTGLDYATGDFVLFWDADDILRAGAVKKLLKIALLRKADVVKGILVRKKGDRTWVTNRHKKIIPSNVAVKLVNHKTLLLDISSCAYLVRSAFLRDNQINFRSGLYMQDVLFSVMVYCRADRIVATDYRMGEYLQLPAAKAGSGLISEARFQSLQNLNLLLNDFIASDKSGVAVKVQNEIYETFINAAFNTFYINAAQSHIKNSQDKDRLVELQILLRKIPEASIICHGVLSENLIIMYELLFLRSGLIENAISMRKQPRMPNYSQLNQLTKKMDFPSDLLLCLSHLSAPKKDKQPGSTERFNQSIQNIPNRTLLARGRRLVGAVSRRILAR